MRGKKSQNENVFADKLKLMSIMELKWEIIARLYPQQTVPVKET